jgi:hypothetical protein
MYFTALLGRLPMTGSKAGDVAIVLVLIAVLMTLIELAAGLFFRNTYNVMLWDYRNERFNYKGVICPKFSLIWGISGCIYFFSINDHVARWVDWLSWHLTFSFVIGFFFGVFAIDVAYSFNLAGRLRSFRASPPISPPMEGTGSSPARLVAPSITRRHSSTFSITSCHETFPSSISLWSMSSEILMLYLSHRESISAAFLKS